MGRLHDQITVKDKARRLVRVAAGLARPASRPRYVAAFRRRLAKDDQPTTGEKCFVCGTADPKHKTIRYTKDHKSVCEVRICRRCGHVANPDNVHDYQAMERPEDFPVRARVGTAERKGREYHIAKMATDILHRRNLSVLIYGAGRSYDNTHIEALDRVDSVALADVMRIRADAEFIDLTEPAPRQFSLVIASEVVEHFHNPHNEFKALFKFVEKNGLLVCSTNVYDGSDLETHKYIFIPGHTSYYTAEALTYIARSNGFYIDFRVPLVATGYGGRRKRYLFLSRNASLMTNVACYFGTHMYAPSERPWANKELAETMAQERTQELKPSTSNSA